MANMMICDLTISLAIESSGSTIVKQRFQVSASCGISAVVQSGLNANSAFLRSGCESWTSLRRISLDHVEPSLMASPSISASVIILHGTCRYTILFQIVGLEKEMAGCPGTKVSMIVLAAFAISVSFESLLKVTVRLFFSVHLARIALML